MRILNKNRKGDITTPQIVLFIVLVASFVVVLIFLSESNLWGITNKEICHNSVVLIDKTLGVTGTLDCKTNYLCISGGGDCEATTSEQIKINPENKEEIMKAIADTMSDCWWMFGEGKLNYGTTEGRSVKYAICSIIEFDNKVQEKIPEISYTEFYDYLEKTQKDKSQTYLEYLYGVNKVSSLRYYLIKINVDQDEIQTNQKYSIITGFDDNISPYPDTVLKVYIIPTSETSLRIIQDNLVSKEFITKA